MRLLYKEDVEDYTLRIARTFGLAHDFVSLIVNRSSDMRWTSRCVTSLVNETTNSNVLGPRGRGGHDGSGSGGGIKGGGEEAKTNLDPRHPHTLPSDNNASERKRAGRTREEKKRQRTKPRARP